MNSKVKSKEKKRLYSLAYIDKLTGVYNRNMLEEMQERLNELECYVSVVEVNKFRLIKVAHGEETTDEILKICVKLIRTCTDDALIFRTGDGEFTVFSELKVDIPSSTFSIGSIYKNTDMGGGNAIRFATSILHSEEPLVFKSPPVWSHLVDYCKDDVDILNAAIAAKGEPK